MASKSELYFPLVVSFRKSNLIYEPYLMDDPFEKHFTKKLMKFGFNPHTPPRNFCIYKPYFKRRTKSHSSLS